MIYDCWGGKDMLQNRLAYLSINYGKIELHLKEILDMHGDNSIPVSERH